MTTSHEMTTHAAAMHKPKTESSSETSRSSISTKPPITLSSSPPSTYDVYGLDTGTCARRASSIHTSPIPPLGPKSLSARAELLASGGKAPQVSDIRRWEKVEALEHRSACVVPPEDRPCYHWSVEIVFVLYVCGAIPRKASQSHATQSEVAPSSCHGEQGLMIQ